MPSWLVDLLLFAAEKNPSLFHSLSLREDSRDESLKSNLERYTISQFQFLFVFCLFVLLPCYNNLFQRLTTRIKLENQVYIFSTSSLLFFMNLIFKAANALTGARLRNFPLLKICYCKVLAIIGKILNVVSSCNTFFSRRFYRVYNSRKLAIFMHIRIQELKFL